MSRLGAWVLAARPRTLAAAAAPVVAGSGIAVAGGVFVRGPALGALAGGLLIQVAANLGNDYYDFVKGGDTEERIGPVRATQAGLLAPESVRRGMIAAMATATAVGVYLAAVAGWPVVVVGAVSLACAVAYTGGPYPLAYHGLGDVFVFVFFGPVAVAGTYYVQGLSVSAEALWAGVGLGAFSTAILVANNLRDRETDAAVGKRTLAVRWGDGGAAAEYVACLGLAAAVPVAGWAWAGWSAWTLLGLAGVAGCGPAARAVLRFAFGSGGKANRRALAPVLERTARGVAVYGVGVAAGFLLGTR